MKFEANHPVVARLAELAMLAQSAVRIGWGPALLVGAALSRPDQIFASARKRKQRWPDEEQRVSRR